MESLESDGRGKESYFQKIKQVSLTQKNKNWHDKKKLKKKFAYLLAVVEIQMVAEKIQKEEMN